LAKPDLPPEALILAIDVGSSSVRAMIFDRHGQALDGVFAQARYVPDTTPDGGSTIDPGAMCSRIFKCIDAALQQAGPRAGRIARVAMDTLVGNLMGIDAHGQPTTPIYTWADVRGANLGQEWTAQLARAGLSVSDYTQRTGCRVHTSYWPLRLLWLQTAEPERFHETAYWLSIGEYVLYRLFGERRVSFSTASWSGLLNRHRLDWDDQTLAVLPIQREQLSLPSSEPFQGLSDEWAGRWPALKDALWLPSIGDGVASNIGAGCTTPRHVALSVGTSGALRVIVPGTPEQVPDGLFAYRVDAARSLIGGPLSNAGNLYAWTQRVLNVNDRSNVGAAVEQMEPDSHGLTILPFLAGERAPGWNDAARAVFMGMTFDTGPEHLIRAGLEAIAYRFYQVAQRLKPLLPPDAVYVASGAPVLNSPAWMQIIADVLGAPVFATTEAETTIRGTVFLATGDEPQARLGQRYEPNAGHHAIYRQAIERQVALYHRLFD
jgi:gluconokinase